MEIEITSDQKYFFRDSGHIEFEGLITPKELTSLRDGLEDALRSSLVVPRGDLSACSPSALYAASRDLWRKSQAVKKLACKPKLAKICADLTSHRELSLAFDQTFRTSLERSCHSGTQKFTEKFTSQPLENIFCIQGIVGAVVICLQGGERSPEDSHIFPTVPGNVVYVDSVLPLDIDRFFYRTGAACVMFGYATIGSLYVCRESDPCNHVLKDHGYTFGDKLRESTHPIILRRRTPIAIICSSVV